MLTGVLLNVNVYAGAGGCVRGQHRAEESLGPWAPFAVAAGK